jgi:hypothetical protein
MITGVRNLAVFSFPPPNSEAYILAGETGVALLKPSHISLGKQLEDVTATVPHKLSVLSIYISQLNSITTIPL